MRKLSKILALVLVLMTVFSVITAITASAAAGQVWTVAGVKALCGTDWNPGDKNNDMTYDAATDSYVKVYTNVKAGSYQFKCAKNHAWGTAYPGSNYNLKVEKDGSTVTITLKGTKVTATVVAPSCDHAYEVTAATVTCLTGGSRTWTCSKCQDSYTENLDALGHYYDESGKCIRCDATAEFVRVYVENAAKWANVYCYTWDTNPYVAWPGEQMKLDSESGLYYYDIPKHFVNVIFNNGDSTQSADLKTPTGTATVYNNSTKKWTALHTCEFVAGEVVAPTFDAEGYTVYTCTCGKTDKRDIVPALVAVAKIGENGYATLAEALEAAKSLTGDVVVEIYDKVTLNTSLSGSYDSIKFVGKDTDAEIYLEVQGYITATDKTVSFEDLTLSKSAGGFITNAGFMNVAFGVYDVNAVNYNNCIFANGAYASSGDVTFTDCTFYRSHDKYGLWAYGNANIVVQNSKFDDYRGIKMYAEDAAKTTDLTVKNTDFSALDSKPAIVLTYGESVTLEGNTYSSTGVFELDLDGAPNGVAVTSDVAPTCKNDNGACGVLVDGKIYTTVAQAAAVATSGSTVTLLHNSAETVEFAEGVTLDKNGYTADGVTIKAPAVYVAQVGDVKYTSVVEALLAAAQNGAPEVKILQSVREKMPTDIEIIVNADLLITADSVVELKFYNDGTSYDFIFNSNNNNTVTIGENVTFELEDRVIWLGYYGNNVDLVVNGTFAAYQIWHGADTTVNATGKIMTTGEAFVMRRGATLTVNGGKVDVNYFNILAGSIFAQEAEITCGAFWISNTDGYAGEGNVNIAIWESTLTSSGNLKATSSNENGIDIDVYESVVKFNDFDGYGACQLDANTTLWVNGENAVLTVKSISNNGVIEVYDNGSFAVNSNVTNNGDIILGAGSSITGPENMDVVVGNDDQEVIYENGKYVVVDKFFAAKVGDVKYTDLQEAIKAAAPAGTVELLADVTVEEWIMIAERLTIADGTIITLDMNGLTIDGNGHTLTVNSIESAGNGGYLFHGASNLNVQDLTIKVAEGFVGGISLKSGNIINVTFEGGTRAVMPGEGAVKIEGCTFKTNGHAVYYEEARNNLVVNNNTFELADTANVILLRGTEQFTNNTVVSGRTVNVVSGSPVVTGNNFGDVRVKVYNVATATISNNTINNLVFNDETAAGSVFADNTLSESAQAALDAVIPNYVAEVGGVKYETLAEAIAAAVDGDTIVLVADIDLGTNSVTVKGKELTLDLNGHNITGSGYRVLVVDLLRVDGSDKRGVLTLTGDGTVKNTGTTTGNSYAVYVGGSSDLIVKTGVTLNSDYGFTVLMAPMGAGRTSTLTLDGGSITGRYGVSGNGTLTDTSTSVTINSGSIDCTEVGIYQPQPGTVTINGGTVSGAEAALALRRGEATITDGAIVGLVDVIGDYEASSLAINGGDLSAATLQYADGNTVTKAEGVVLAAPEGFAWINDVLVAHAEHSYEKVVTAPTCTEAGYTTYTCACGHTYTGDEVAALGHDLVDVEALAATCTTAGYTAHRDCSRCDYVEGKEVIDALGHKDTRLDAKCDVCGQYFLPTSPFKLEMYQASKKQTYYFTGSMSGYYFATSTDITKAVDLYAEEVEGGYNVYFMNGSTKNYLYIQLSGTHINAKFGTTKAVWYVDATYGCLTTEVNGTKYFLGTYSNYVTFGGTAYSRLTASTADVSQYVGRAVSLENHVCAEFTSKVTAPTCTAQGYTTKTCVDCGAVTKVDYVDALGHDLVDVEAKDPTCTEAGYTAHKDCSRCTYVEGKETVAALGHTEVVDKAVAPTCTETGLTEGSHCSVCEAVIVAQNEVPALGHTEVIDEAVAPTCTETGLTEGKHCSVCEEVLVAQKEVPALGHTFGEVTVTTEPTCTVAGEGTHTCSVCGVTETVEVAALGHVEVLDKEVAPTCTEAGLTKGSHCSVCNEVLAEQQEVPALGHTFVDGECECGAKDPSIVPPVVEPEVEEEEDLNAFEKIWAFILSILNWVVDFFKGAFVKA